MKTKLIDITKLNKSGIRHEMLPDGFIVRVQKYKEILKEVETLSLEETISNFQRDMFPETELNVWESIATCFRITLPQQPTLDDRTEETSVYRTVNKYITVVVAM